MQSCTSEQVYTDKVLLKEQSGRFSPIAYVGQVKSHNLRNFFLLELQPKFFLTFTFIIRQFFLED